MIRRAASALLGCCLLAATLAACGGPGAGSPSLPPAARVSIFPDDPSLPYGIVAIDYHFHDAHPSRPLATTRTVVFSNQGTLKHNVTFLQFHFSQDFRPGQTITIKDLGKKLGGPGVYTFFCKYHADLGMIGTIIVT
jgi:Cupredoxin-like domain